ncbi:AAA family ATPase [Pseudalkalibacillus hwajinpoensis]|uniref:ATP-binding protein n=1 Tax=Guptibacillus hwajinpoensis TaxID=208199 RepID=UPI00325ABFC7
MKLIGLHIYGFGKFEDYQLTNISSRLQLIFGENEAGKSTLLAFIDCILFGFPNRNEDPHAVHGRYGGKISIEYDGDELLIERTKGKASGDVTVHYSNGTTGNEEDLKRLLKGMNRTSFRQIYFCDLTTLNDYKHYDENSWNQVLYEAGMTGGASLLSVEKSFEKRMGDLFKPGGRKPALNVEVEQWESLQKRTREWEKKNGEFNKLEKKLENLEEEITAKADRLEQLQGERRKLDREKTVHPLLKERRRLESQLQNLPESDPFPEGGLERMEKWKEQVVLQTGEAASIEKRQRRLKEEMDGYEINSEWKMFLHEVNSWKEQMTLYRARLEERKVLEREIAALKSKLTIELDELGYSEEQLSMLITTFAAREELKQIMEGRQRSDQQYEYLNEGFLSARDELVKEESEYERLKARLPSEAKSKHPEEESNKAPSGKNRKGQAMMALIALLLLIGIGFYENWILGFIVAAIVLVGAFFIDRIDGGTEQAVEDMELRRRLEQAKEQIERLNRNYLKAAEKVDHWEAERFRIEKAVSNWKSAYSFPESLPAHSMLDAFDRTASIKKVEYEIQHKNEQLEELDYSLKVVEDGIRKLCESTNIAYHNPEKAIQQLVQKTEDHRETSRIMEKLKDQFATLEEHAVDTREKLVACQEEVKQLLQAAETENEEAFLIKGHAHKEKMDLARQLVTIDSQLDQSDLATHRSSIEEIEEEQVATKREENSLMKVQQELYQQLAVEREQIRQLTEEGTYEDLLLQRKQKEDEMNDLAWKWSVVKVASDLLSKAKARYQEERLPAVLKKAEHYFSLLTEGRYTAIFPPSNDSGFRVMHEEGRAYRPSELSRGTREQLYLCIRLALASISSVSLPIFLDDIFVNFDAKRAARAKEFIIEFSKDHQVILLTCHKETIVGLGENVHILERTGSSKKVQ